MAMGSGVSSCAAQDRKVLGHQPSSDLSNKLFSCDINLQSKQKGAVICQIHNTALHWNSRKTQSLLGAAGFWEHL